MAYTTAQYIQNLQVGTISFTPSAPSGYALYTNGTGQTYWASALDAQNLSTFSTTIYTYIGTNNSNIANVMSLMQTQIDTGSTLINYQSTSVSSVIGSFSALSTSLTIQTSSMYYSTLAAMNSTLYGFSTFSSFFVQIDALDKKFSSGLSTISTIIYTQTSNTYVSIISTLNSSIQSTMRYIDANVAALTASSVNKSDFNVYSNVITNQLLSTSLGQTQYISSVFNPISNALSTLSFSTSQYISSFKSIEPQLSSLTTMSTNIYSTTLMLISSYVSTNQYFQNIATQGSIDNLSTNIGYISLSNTANYQYISSISFSSINSINITNSNITTLRSDVDSLEAQFNTFTTTGVLASIYSSFMQLEEFSYSLVESTIKSVHEFESSLYYSTTLQNMSISKDYYNFFVSSLYNSTLSTLNVQTNAYTSTLMSTLYASGFDTLFKATVPVVISSYSSTINFMLQSTNTTMISNATIVTSNILRNIEASTNSAYNSFILSTNIEYNTFINQLEVQTFMSTLYTRSTINLHGTNYNGLMDFNKYRNINVNIYNLSNGPSNYSLTYDPNTLVGYDYIRGFITINVSTINNMPYTNNGGKLQFDVYRWGIPTTVWGNFFPSISQGDYSIHYDYTIINKTLYTNLINVYPRLSVSFVNISSFTTGFPRGSNIRVSWSNYSGINLSNIGAPFTPTVSIETYNNNSLVKGFGPYLFNSTATIQSPSISGNTDIVVRVTGLYDGGFLTNTITVV